MVSRIQPTIRQRAETRAPRVRGTGAGSVVVIVVVPVVVVIVVRVVLIVVVIVIVIVVVVGGGRAASGLVRVERDLARPLGCRGRRWWCRGRRRGRGAGRRRGSGCGRGRVRALGRRSGRGGRLRGRGGRLRGRRRAAVGVPRAGHVDLERVLADHGVAHRAAQSLAPEGEADDRDEDRERGRGASQDRHGPTVAQSCEPSMKRG
ncbi:hypothetical protein DNL40_03205 [Xylanimonas oleitrophica]|uniref:Uncharacterized protein n=1 Tax=Xylanimonas oleitrophica TaxID=2607479 RepID=A0A2W5Y9M0_9MICO|nr:hypothetical protein DNL40_03205 [Xylanimonas oleitrophica]